jgi:AcrR family transcriptional regulator
MDAVVMMLSKGERTRLALIDAAIRRFGQDGSRGASVSDVARDVGITPGSVYAYFPSKQELFLAALDADAECLIERAIEVIGPEFVSDWALLFTTLLSALDEHPLARRVLLGEEGTAADRLLVLPAEARLHDLLVERLRVAQGRGLVRSDVDPEIMIDGLTTLLMALLIAALQTGGGGNRGRPHTGSHCRPRRVAPRRPTGALRCTGPTHHGSSPCS